MSTIPERLEKLRAKMQEKGIDIYIIPTADFHQSEYVGEHFKAREYITGFTGSAGTAVVSKTEARLWTDGRYFIQAAKQLEGTTVELMKMGQPGVPKIGEYLETALAEGETVGFDGRVVSVTEGEEYEKIASEKNGKVVYAYDLIDEVWEDRPILSEEPVFELEQKYTGETVESKLARTRAAMKEAGATAHVLTTLDDICWTLNIRGNDVEYFPLVLTYAVIRMDKVDLFVNEKKLSDEIKAHLAADGVILHPYNDIYEDIKKVAAEEVLMVDPGRLNFALYKNIPENVKKVEERNPAILFKCVKNPTEVENIRIAEHAQVRVRVQKALVIGDRQQHHLPQDDVAVQRFAVHGGDVHLLQRFLQPAAPVLAAGQQDDGAVLLLPRPDVLAQCGQLVLIGHGRLGAEGDQLIRQEPSQRGLHVVAQ